MQKLKQILSTWLGAKQRTQASYPKTRLVARGNGAEYGIERPANGRKLFTVSIEGLTYSNSKLGDLKYWLNQMGYTVHRVGLEE